MAVRFKQVNTPWEVLRHSYSPWGRDIGAAMPKWCWGQNVLSPYTGIIPQQSGETRGYYFRSPLPYVPLNIYFAAVLDDPIRVPNGIFFVHVIKRFRALLRCPEPEIEAQLAIGVYRLAEIPELNLDLPFKQMGEP